jgi:GTPase SAR1 family protein
MIIVIGPDKAGKTTLVQKLKHFGYETRKAVRIEDRKQMAEAINNLLNTTGDTENLVLDRWYYPDECIYEPVIKGTPHRLVGLESSIEKALNRMHTLLLYVTASEEVLTRRFEADGGDPYVSANNLGDILNAYEEFLSQTTLPFKIIDTSNIDPSQVLAKAMTIIANFQLRTGR